MGNRYNREIKVPNSPDPISLENMKTIISQMKNSICQIRNNDNYGTGFFCIIPFPDQYDTLPVLITCNHVLEENDLYEGNKIEIFFQLDKKEKKKTILIDNLRKTFTNKEIDTTIIEIRREDDEDELINFLNIDYKSYKNKLNELYTENSQIYIIRYIDGKEAENSLGKIKKNNLDEKEYFFKHSGTTYQGDSGSPILSFYNNKVLGIHKGEVKVENLNLGVKIRFPIEMFIKKYKENNNNYIKIAINLDVISTDNEKKYNNILYYYENINKSLRNILNDYFRENKNGCFILCDKEESLTLLKKEIIKENKKDNRITFNIIITGNDCEKVINFLKENTGFEKLINNIYVYDNIDKYYALKNKYKKVYKVSSDSKDIKNFIIKTSSEKIKPYPLINVVTLNNYKDKYNKILINISKSYGKKLDQKVFNHHLNKLKFLINEDWDNNELINMNKDELINSFSIFGKDKKLIIKEYTKNTFYKDLNRWLMNPNENYYDTIAYFISILMFSLNSFAKEKKMFCNEDKKILYKGFNLEYSSLLQYEKAKGEIILFPIFISTIEDKKRIKGFFSLNNSKFRTIMNITNNHKRNWISNVINIKSASLYKEREFVFLPFSFFYLKDIRINIEEFTAEIDLETIGKTEILEYKFQNGNEIEYNQNENIIQIKKKINDEVFGKY